jgi:hypothetical protein
LAVASVFGELMAKDEHQKKPEKYLSKIKGIGLHANEYKAMKNTPVFMIDKEGNFYSFEKTLFLNSRGYDYWV